MRLAQLQQAFFDCVTGLGEPPTWLLERLHAQPGVDLRQRVEVYRAAYRGRLLELLAAQYPRFAARLDPQRFDALVAHCALGRPPHSPLSSTFALEFFDFLCTQPDVEPAALELARLEHARALAAQAADVPPAAPGEPAPAQLIPSLAVVRAQCDVAALFLQPTGAVEQRPTAVAVWRRGLQVLHAKVPEPEATALARGLTGAQWSEVARAAATPEPVLLERWRSRGWLCR